MMEISARNQLAGTVSGLIQGAVNDEVVVKLTGGQEIVANITHRSVVELSLTTDKQVYAIIKAPLVMLMKSNANLKISARNCLPVKITEIETARVSAEVITELAGSGTIKAMITKDAVEEMGLKVGDEVIAVVKASHIILAIEG